MSLPDLPGLPDFYAAAKTLYRSLIDILFPPACPLCRSPLLKQAICDGCLDSFERVRPPYCTHCGTPFINGEGENHLCGKCIITRPPFDSAASLYLYKGALSGAVRLLKYSKKSLVGPHLGELMVHDRSTCRPYDVIVAVPLHISRLRERGFNQSQLLAESLGKGLSLNVDPYILERVRATGSQAGMNSRDRAKNVKNAFALRKSANVAGKSVLLVDDVYTTGATVKECSAVLKKGGAGEVHVLTLARVVEKNA